VTSTNITTFKLAGDDLYFNKIFCRGLGPSSFFKKRLNLQGIHAVNLGDSGFTAVRDGRTVLMSSSQQHDFNFTYQLESGGGSDLPSSAQVSKSQPFCFEYFIWNF
jgi:hypothetical protein